MTDRCCCMIAFAFGNEGGGDGFILNVTGYLTLREDWEGVVSEMVIMLSAICSFAHFLFLIIDENRSRVNSDVVLSSNEMCSSLRILSGLLLSNSRSGRILGMPKFQKHCLLCRRSSYKSMMGIMASPLRSTD